jgi:hypothetical protein
VIVFLSESILESMIIEIHWEEMNFLVNRITSLSIEKMYAS